MQHLTHPIIVIVGPAAVGKTTVVKALHKRFPALRSSVTYTTRPPRQHAAGEDKVMYYVSEQEFVDRKNKGEFLESAIVHGNMYGTHAAETEALLAENPVIFNVDIQGLEQLKTHYGTNMVSIFIAPESMEQLIARLRSRGEMSEENFQERLRSAERELARQGECDYTIVNREGKLTETIEEVAAIIEPYCTLDKIKAV